MREYRTARQLAAPEEAEHGRAFAATDVLVVLPSGEPAAGALATLDPGWGQAYVKTADRTGHLSASFPCVDRCKVTATSAPDLVAGPVLVSSEGGPLRLVLQRAPAVLSGHVGDGQAPVGGAGVQLRDARQSSFTSIADDAGAYSLGFTPGKHRVSAGGSATVMEHQWRDLDASQTLDVIAPPAGFVTVSSPATSLFVSPPPAESVDLTTMYRDEGKLVIGPVPVGPRTVWAANDTRVGYAEVEVRAGQETEVAIELGPGASLSGRVVAADGTSIGGAKIAVDAPVAREGRTGDNGFYRLAGLAAGHLAVRAEADGFVPVVKEIDTVAGAATALAFTMNRASPP